MVVKFNRSLKFILLSSVVCLLIILFSFSSCKKDNFTDWDEYGFNGKVKAVETITYMNIKDPEAELIPSDQSAFKKRIISFNEKGEIIKEEYWIKYEDKFETAGTFSFFYENGKKIWATISTDYSDHVDEYFFEWISKTEYKFTDTSSFGTVVINTAQLSEDNGRDLSGTTKIWKNDTLITDEEYLNVLEGNRIITTHMDDHLNNTSIIYEVIYLKEDEYNNPTEYYMINKETGRKTQYLKRTFTYFD